MNTKKKREGEKHYLKDGSMLEIIDYIDCNNCTIKFTDGTILYNRKYDHIKSKNIKNPYTPIVQEIGYFGVGKYQAFNKNTKIFKNYQTWNDLLKRCYNKNTQKKQPTYTKCSAIEEWHCFQNFAKWHEENYIEGWQLDKDILVKGNKIYSPQTCCFVPQEINKLFTRRENKRGKYPIGVNKNKLKYEAYLSKGNGIQKFLGSFITSEEAFQAYKIAKEGYIKEVADRWKTFIEPRVYEAMYEYQVEITD